MKTILTEDKEIKRVSNEEAEELVKNKKATFVPKSMFKKLKDKNND